MQQPAPTTEGIEYTPVEDVEEVNPLDVITSLERDLEIAQAALRKIVRMNPAMVPGGPNNKYFGRGTEKAFKSCQTISFEALERMENHTDE